MKIEEAVADVRTRLSDAGLDEAQMESEFLVASVLGLSRAELFVRRQADVASPEAARITLGASQRASRQPLAYIVGEQPFGDLVLSVSPAVLVPRPETEILVEKILALMDTPSSPLMITDVGTGSGAIALSLSRHRNAGHVIGVDISGDALAIARENAERYDTAKRCEWRLGNLLNALGEHEWQDVIVANLPYIRQADLAGLSPEVQKEPRLALDGGVSGLDLIYRLIDQAPDHLRFGGTLWLEVGFDQAEAVQAYLASASSWEPAVVYKDLSGISRIVCARRKDNTWMS